MSTPVAPLRPDRNSYIDTLRGVSIVGVVCVHFGGSFVTTDLHAWSPSFLLGLGLNQVFCFAVPMFVFLSGLLAASSRREVPLADYYRGRFHRIVVPYLIASIPAFFLLNHYAEWSQLPDFAARLRWLAEHLLYQGVEPTLYFIPLILQLYLVQPVLKALPAWAQRLAPRLSLQASVALLALFFFTVHVVLGILCFRGTLNYYVWGRPSAFFWAFYFFAGLHFRTLTSPLSRRTVLAVSGGAGVIALAALAWNLHHLLDRSLMGDHFQFNPLDLAYVRPEMLLYDVAAVLALGLGVTLGWFARPGLLSYLGQFTLEIYLWHILLLYFAVWRYSDALASCRAVPELIIIICVGVAAVIAAATDLWHRTKSFFATHRIVLVRRE